MNLKYMEEAFNCAKEAYNLDEVPIGAVIVKNDVIIGRGYNKKEKNMSVIAHAEIIAIEEAAKHLNNWRLDGCDIYVTLDPCPMCASAIKQSRIGNVYSACNNSFINNEKILKLIFETDNTNPSVNYISNLNVEKSQKIMNNFFKKQRND